LVNRSIRPLLAILALGTGIVLASACARKEESKAPVATGKHLPDSAFRVEWMNVEIPSTVSVGQEFVAKVTFKNASDQTWPTPATAGGSTPGAFAVRLSFRWQRATGPQDVLDFKPRVELPRPLAPGESVTLPIKVAAPANAGEQKLQFDLVQELFAWFSDRGAAQKVVTVTVK
jgi:hypothetical protein